MYTEIRFTLNGEQKLYQGDPLRRLLDVLREDYGLTGSKEGCGEGECGACSIIKNGELITSCIIPVGAVNGCELLTIEGIRDTEKGKCIIDAYAEGGAVQCGFCIPGMVMATYVLLSRNPDPTEEEIRVGISGNICRCTGYDLIRRVHPTRGEERSGLMEQVKCFIPETLEEALRIRKETGATVLAGGSDLMVANSMGAGVTPAFKGDVLIITNLKELKGICELPDGSVEIGACTTSAEIARSPIAPELLKDAASRMGAIACATARPSAATSATRPPRAICPSRSS